MKTATFSTGATDTYKGKRDVKAAWGIIINGEVVCSGHSLDRARAQKTAESNTEAVLIASLTEDQKAKMVPYTYSPRMLKGTSQEFISKMKKAAAELGYETHKDHYEAYKADIAKAVRELVTIEVVDV